MLRIFELPPEEEIAQPASAELRSVVQAREGDSIYDYDWYPAMDSSEPLTCCFVSAARDHPLHLWDAYTGGLRGSYLPYNHLDEIVCAYSSAFDLSGGKIFCGFDRAIRIFDVSRPGRQCEVRLTSPTRKSRAGQVSQARSQTRVAAVLTHLSLPHCSQRGIISSFAFAPDYSGLFAAGSYSGCTVRLSLAWHASVTHHACRQRGVAGTLRRE